MTDRKPTLELLLRYLDNDLPSNERTDVQDLLRQNQAAREMFREIAQQAVVIADVARVSGATCVERTAEVSSDIRGRLAARQRLLLAVAAIAFLAVTVSLLRLGGEPAIVTIKALNGPVEWIGSGGRVTEGLAVGRALPGGTIELLSADSWIEFEFHDESTVTLSGQSAVTISEQKQKELHLRYGSLSANVQPQPTDCPMLVHTPSAELKVLGTQFNVDALPEATRLAVNEGRVRLKRLTDGKEIVVPAKHEVTASMEDQNGLPLNARARAVSVWKSDLREDVVRGKWLSDHWMLGMRLKKAVASGEISEADAVATYKNAAALDAEGGSVWADASPYGSLVLLSVARSSATPVALSATASIRIRGRLHSRVSVRFGITTKESAGGFGGKYSISVEDDALRGDDNSFEIELPLSTFEEETEFGNSLIGKELSDWWCVAESTSAKLEITNVELIE
ncbi:MAG: FecR domain-containing protein [Planctomycetales bacterium]|jgi:ferric-dicitrate binding protein FerR (iron transport regulator)